MITPLRQDVLCGRGGMTNNHHGNAIYRSVIERARQTEKANMPEERLALARSIVDAVHNQTPPGRFLSFDKDEGKWVEISHKQAVNKTKQALREKPKKNKKNKKTTTTTKGNNDRIGTNTKLTLLPKDDSNSTSPSHLNGKRHLDKIGDMPTATTAKAAATSLGNKRARLDKYCSEDEEPSQRKPLLRPKKQCYLAPKMPNYDDNDDDDTNNDTTTPILPLNVFQPIPTTTLNFSNTSSIYPSNEDFTTTAPMPQPIIAPSSSSSSSSLEQIHDVAKKSADETDIPVNSITLARPLLRSQSTLSSLASIVSAPSQSTKQSPKQSTAEPPTDKTAAQQAAEQPQQTAAQETAEPDKTAAQETEMTTLLERVTSSFEHYLLSDVLGVPENGAASAGTSASVGGNHGHSLMEDSTTHEMLRHSLMDDFEDSHGHARLRQIIAGPTMS